MADTTPTDFDLAHDQEWAQYGDELDLGTELLIEWGVKISGAGMYAIYSLYGSSEDDERDAREFVRTYAGDRTVEVVARRVLYGPWGERNG